MSKKKLSSSEELIQRLLEILGADAVSNAKKILQENLGDDETEHPGVGRVTLIRMIDVYAGEAVERLVSDSVDNENPDFLKFTEKLNLLRDSLHEVNMLMVDDDIQRLLRYFAANDEDPTEVVMNSYRKTFQRNQRLLIQMAGFIYDPSVKRGRPALTELNKYIGEIVALYERVSKKPFTVMKHKDTTKKGGSYNPITTGHEFVTAAVEFVNEMAKAEGATSFFTDRNIYNVCEKVRSTLKKEPR